MTFKGVEMNDKERDEKRFDAFCKKYGIHGVDRKVAALAWAAGKAAVTVEGEEDRRPAQTKGSK